MKRQNFIEIQRMGQIQTTAAQATENQCGHNGHQLYHYEFRIGVTNPGLDDRGFLVDHNDVHKKIIEHCSRKIPSCEILVLDLCNCISDELLKMNVKHDYVFLRVSTGVFTSEGQGMKAVVYLTPHVSDPVKQLFNRQTIEQ